MYHLIPINAIKFEFYYNCLADVLFLAVWVVVFELFKNDPNGQCHFSRFGPLCIPNHEEILIVAQIDKVVRAS